MVEGTVDMKGRSRDLLLPEPPEEGFVTLAKRQASNGKAWMPIGL
jgi:hypothetical protein